MDTLSGTPSNQWPLQDAKARFSELVNRVLSKGAQIVTRHGEPTVAIVPMSEYLRLTARTVSLGTFLTSAPRVELVIERSRDTGRDVDV
jgi:antitoxin Phd